MREVTLMLVAATTDGWAVACLGVVIAATVGLIWALDERKRRLAVEGALRAERSRPPMAHPDEAVRDNLQRRIGEIHLAKLEAELELLRRQVASKELDEDRNAAGKEYHELMVEKARLEIDSLRLHIVEQRKRMDVWRDDEGL